MNRSIENSYPITMTDDDWGQIIDGLTQRLEYYQGVLKRGYSSDLEDSPSVDESEWAVARYVAIIEKLHSQMQYLSQGKS